LLFAVLPLFSGPQIVEIENTLSLKTEKMQFLYSKNKLHLEIVVMSAKLVLKTFSNQLVFQIVFHCAKPRSLNNVMRIVEYAYSIKNHFFGKNSYSKSKLRL